MKRTLALVVGVCVVMTTVGAWAQGPGGPGGGPGGFGRGGRGGFGGGRMGMGLLGLLRIEAVQNEIDLVEDQKAEIDALAESLQGEGGRRGGPGGGDRPNFQEMSDEEREKFMEERRQQAQQRTAKEKEELAKILLEPQMQRLNEIALQVRGVDALNDAEVAAKLEITDEQKTQIAKVQEESGAAMREQMQALRDQNEEFDPEQMRTKMAEMRKANEEKVLAVLTAEQKTQFASMKGAAFELPPDAMFGGRGGRGGFGGGFGGGRGGDRGGDRGGRPQRPE